MSAVPNTITPEVYLSKEREADFKSEYYRGEVFAMSGGSPRHSLIAANFIREAGNGLKDKPCSVFTGDLRVKVSPSGLYSYPDASIVCGDLEFDDDKKDTVTNPTVLVEVLSESTERYDRGAKSRLYRELPSLRELLLVDQKASLVQQFIRQENGGWLLFEKTDLAELVKLDSIDIEIPLSEIYRGVQFDEPSTP